MSKKELIKDNSILVATGAYEMTSGAAHFFVELARWLEDNSSYHIIAVLEKRGSLFRELKTRNIETYVIPQKEKWIRKINEKKNLGVTLLQELVRPIVVGYGYMLLNNLLSRKHIRIVHVNGLTRGMIAKSAIKQGIPVIWHIHEFMEEDLGIEFIDEENAVKLVDHSELLIAVSEAVKGKFIHLFSPRIEVVYNCFSCKKKEDNDKWNDTNVLRICIVGRLMRQKGQFELVKAISLLDRYDLDRVKVFIVGSVLEQEYKNEIDNLIQQSHIEQHIEFCGYISDPSAIYSNIHCVCVCSDMEAFGRTTVEGMLNHCVLIGANTGGTSELISNEKTGLLYQKNNPNNLSDKISYCINHISECKKIADSAFVFASKKFDIDKEYGRFIQYYSEIIGDKG